MKLITVYINTNVFLFYPLDTKNAIEHTHGGFLTMVFHLKYPTQLGITENIPIKDKYHNLILDLTKHAFIVLHKLIQ